MLKRLYNEEVHNTELTSSNSGINTKETEAKETLRAKLMNRQDFNASYLSFVFVGCCKCFKCCFSGSRSKRHLESYKKF